MKWYNEDQTACLDLDKIGFWVYKKEELKVFLNSSEPLCFYGNEAEAIYKKLTYEKQVL